MKYLAMRALIAYSQMTQVLRLKVRFMIHEKPFGYISKTKGTLPIMRAVSGLIGSIGFVIFSTLASAAETLVIKVL